MIFSKEELLETYENLSYCRAYEKALETAALNGTLKGFQHLALGEEAVLAGVYSEFGPNDWLQPHNVRSTALEARVLSAKVLSSELAGGAEGIMNGLGGVAHVYSPEHRFGPICAEVGQHFAPAAGIALSYKMDQVDGCVIIGLGDGSMNEGAVSEALNMIAIWKLPVVIYIQNNQVALSQAVEKNFAVKHIAERVRGFGIPCDTYDGTDVLTVRATMRELMEKARKGEPQAAEFVTNRWSGHFLGDPMPYRSKEYIAYINTIDPLQKYKDYLVHNEFFTREELDAIDAKNHAECEEGLTFGLKTATPKTAEFVRDVSMVYKK